MFVDAAAVIPPGSKKQMPRTMPLFHSKARAHVLAAAAISAALLALAVGALLALRRTQRRRHPVDIEPANTAPPGLAAGQTPAEPAQPAHAMRTPNTPTSIYPAPDCAAPSPSAEAEESSRINDRDGERKGIEITIYDYVPEGQEPPTFGPGDNRKFVPLPRYPPTPRSYREHTLSPQIFTGSGQPSTTGAYSVETARSRRKRRKIAGIFTLQAPEK